MLIFFAFVLFFSWFSQAAPVELYAGDFLNMEGHPLAKHPVQVFIDSTSNYTAMFTDSFGFLRLDVDVGSRLFVTLVSANGFTETTSAISVVPENGLVGVHRRIVLQVPSVLLFDFFKVIVPRKIVEGTCVVVVTITNFNKTYTDCPQGWPGVSPIASPAGDFYENPYFFGTWGTLSNYTNPLPNNLTSTSWDGGVLFPAVKVSEAADQTITGEYGNFPFSKTTVRCLRPGQFINAAPNQGPAALEPLHKLSTSNDFSLSEHFCSSKLYY